MRLITIAPLRHALPEAAAPAKAEATEPAAPGEVAILLDSGAALTLSALAAIASWPVSAGMAQLSLIDLLSADPELNSIREAFVAADRTAVAQAVLPAGSFRFGAPIPRPGKTIGVGYNYLDHVHEQGLERPARPVLFSMFANAVTGDGDPIRRPAGTHALDLEAELAVVVGRRASRVAVADALTHVAGYTAANDVTARDWQGQAAALKPGEQGDRQWLRAKGSDTFLPMGPVFVTADELGDGTGLAVRSWLARGGGPDGGVPFAMQDGNTAQLMFSVAELISMISTEVTLDPGDVIVTGTPSGVGVFRRPPIFLEPGDLVQVEVDRIGTLTNPITDEDGHAPDGSPAALLLAGL
jgi:2-keto-4-pentenoate hydratase/2-oxohepta-3-ene-1,7-dioic acid hydratase in catechol pathway